MKSKYGSLSWAYITSRKILYPKRGLPISLLEHFDLTKWRKNISSCPSTKNGFYLESTYGDLTAQVLIKSTDLAAYFTTATQIRLFWVNNLKTGKAEASANVFVSADSKNYITDASGIASFNTVPADPKSNEPEYYIVRSGNNELILMNYRYRTYYNSDYAYDDYWRYFQTDRNLYKPDDQVAFWGFLQKRGYGTSPKSVKVEISQGGYWGIPEARFLSYYLPSIQKPLVTLDVAEGRFLWRASSSCRSFDSPAEITIITVKVVRSVVIQPI